MSKLKSRHATLDALIMGLDPEHFSEFTEWFLETQKPVSPSLKGNVAKLQDEYLRSYHIQSIQKRKH